MKPELTLLTCAVVLTLLGAQIFVYARLAYAAVYTIGLPWIRTGVWAVSVVGLALIFLQTI